MTHPPFIRLIKKQTFLFRKTSLTDDANKAIQGNVVMQPGCLDNLIIDNFWRENDKRFFYPEQQ